MIFHTAAEQNYYNAFFKIWHRNIAKHVPNATFSLKFVGDTSNTDVIEFCKNNNINLILDPTNMDKLIDRYGTEEKARGYYPMARWNSIPVVNEHVCVTDVDVVMLKNEIELIEKLLEHNDFVSISRKDKKLMINYINKKSCETVKNYAQSLMNDKNFRWDLDVDVMGWMVKNLKYESLSKLEKFDSSANRLKRTDFSNESSFGYYSSMSFTHEGITYPNGFKAKSAKYLWASNNKLI